MNSTGSVASTPYTIPFIVRAHEPGTDAADDGAGERRRHALTKHLREHLAAPRAKRHAQADLVRPLRDHKRHHAVDPHRRK